jgi:hypothetical protein
VQLEVRLVVLGVVRRHFELRLVEPLGKETLLYFDYGGDQSLIAVAEGTREFQTGDRLGLMYDPKRLYLFDADGKRIYWSAKARPRHLGFSSPRPPSAPIASDSVH